MTQDELKMVLEALKWCHGGEPCGTAEAIAVVEKALAQPEHEPVIDKSAAIRIATVLGWTPPRTWVGLTLTQVKLLGEGVQEEAIKSGHSRDWVFYTHINEALKEKNT